jgi:hypothetical protein
MKGRKEEVDELFQLPLSEFIGARNAIASRLKKAGEADDAQQVKALRKPSVTAWAANQLYWKQRDAFDALMRAAGRVRDAQASQLSGKPADVRGALAERQEALADLSRLAVEILRESGHAPAPETLRRLNTTLEALSVDSTSAGRLTDDLDPPGFESMFALVPASSERRSKPARPDRAAEAEARRIEREARIAAARAEVADAERVLAEATAAARKAIEVVKDAEDRLAEAQKRLERHAKHGDTDRL